MSNRPKKIIGVFIYICILILLILAVTRYLEPKKDAYYLEKEWDVVFFGTSEAYCTFNPAVLTEYGLKAYNHGMPVQNMGMTYYYVKDAFEHASIDTVVLEIYGMSFGEDKYEDYEYAEMSINAMPNSRTKLEAARTFMPENQQWGYLFPLDKFHGEWENKNYESVNDFLQDVTKVYFVDENAGFMPADDIVPFENYPDLEIRKSRDCMDLPARNYEYLEQIYQVCQENNARLILVKGPVPCYSYVIEASNSVENWAIQHGVEYINYMQIAEEIGFDADLDVRDGGEHLNTAGANKVTEALANYLLNGN